MIGQDGVSSGRVPQPNTRGSDGRTAMRPYEIRPEALRRESPERAHPSLVTHGGTPQPVPAPLSAREVGEFRSRAPGVRAVRPYELGAGGGPVGESREGAALFGGGMGVPPQPLPAPLLAREVGESRSQAPGVMAMRPYELGAGGAPAGESREGAAALFGGAWGYPPTSTRSTSRQGNGRVPQPSTWGQGHAPLRTRGWRRSSGRVQRGRSPLWWGHGGTPRKPYPHHFPPGKWAGPAGSGTGGGPAVVDSTPAM